MLRVVVVLTVLFATTAVAQLTRSMLAIVVLLAGTAAAQGPPAAEQPAAARQIRGVIVAAENGAALPRVRLTLAVVGAAVEPVFTDDRGRFVLTIPPSAVPPLRATAARAGFATTTIRVTREDLSSPRAIEVRLARGAAISGRVVNPAGGPVVSAVVILRPASSAAGAAATRAMTPVAAQTDDLGEYRFGGLPEGRYSLQVADVPGVAAETGFGVEPGVGATAIRTPSLRAFNERLQNEPLNRPTDVSEAIAVAVRAGDDVGAADLVVTAHIVGGALCRASREPPTDDPSATAAIRGRVLDSSGRPLSCALVSLAPLSGAGDPSSLGTDPAGRFTFTGLRPGAYTVGASTPAYNASRYGQDRANPAGRSIALRDGESVDRVDVVLSRRPAVTGTVLDDHGEPVAGVTVRALRLRATGDLTMAVNAPGVAVRPTDDRGQYRLFGFPPGRYLIGTTIDASVADPDGAYGYAPIFYPATNEVATASALDVGAEGDITAVNLVLVRSPTRRISGFAFDASGGPASEVVVFPSVRSSGILLEPRQGTVGPDGAFSISNVSPGEYVVQATAPGPERDDRGNRLPPDFGMVYVTVGDRDPAPVIVAAASGSTVEGTMIARGGSAIETLLFHEDVGVWPIPTDVDRSPLGGRRSFASLDGARFRIAGVTGSRRFVLERPPDGWYLESVTVNGRDALNRSFDFGTSGERFTDVEAVLSDAGAAVTGQIVDDRGAAVRGPSVVSVMVFTTDESRWIRESQHVKVGRPGRDGVFRVGSLPPGEYFVAAYDPPDAAAFRMSEWQDTALLADLASRAERIVLGARDVRQVTVRSGGR